MSLYRKYRPASFADIAGQRSVVTTLEQAVAQDKLSHAYLFAGTRGTGKTSTARILAKVLLTREMEEGPLKEQVKQAVDEGNLVDLVEIDAASNRGIDDIRSLVEKIQFSPLVAKAKVYIIDEVHMLTREAFNALLKTLEEPPPYAYFILATTELHKIPATIQSRCQRYLFRQIGEQDIVDRLKFIAQQEKIQVDDDALLAIAHSVQGGLRDAVSLLDQLRSLEYIRVADVRQRTGESGIEYVEQMMKALRESDREAVLHIIQRLEEIGVPLEQFARLLLTQLRVDLHQAIEQKRSTIDAQKFLDVLLTVLKDLRSSPVPGLAMEAALLSLCTSSTIQPASAPAGATSGKPSSHSTIQPKPLDEAPSSPSDRIRAGNAQAPKPEDASQSEIKNPSTELRTGQPSAISLSTLKDSWPQVIQTVEPPSARMSLKNASVLSLEEGTVLLSFASTFHREKAMTPEALHNLENALEKALGVRIVVKASVEPEIPEMPESGVVNMAEAIGEVF